MNELIKIEVIDSQQLVSGRELHKFLEIGTEYMKWFSRIIEKYNFIENKDFTVIVKNDEDDTAFGGIRKSTDHLMTLNMAKEIAMVSNIFIFFSKGCIEYFEIFYILVLY